MIFRSKKADSAQAPQAGTSSGANRGINTNESAARTANAGAQPSAEEVQRRAISVIRQSLAFTQIIAVLMRSPHYKHYTLADLEWLVLPPLLTGQMSVAEASAQKDGPRFPIAVALWASVSAEVDKRLSENLQVPIRLRPDEWRSGDILWLIDAVGDARFVPQFVKQLDETVFKGRDVKMRARREDGTAVVNRIAARP